MHLTEESVAGVLETWQCRLFLRDWTVRVEVAGESWPKSGDIKIDPLNMLAVLLVNEAVAPENLDEAVVHELVHLKLHALDRMMEDLLNGIYGDDEEDPRRTFAHAQFMDRLEATTQDITRSLLALTGDHELMVSPHIRSAVEKELEPGSRPFEEPG